jgi:hypothetical protein
MDDGREGGVSMRESESANVDMVTRTIRIWRVRMIDTGGSGMAKGKETRRDDDGGGGRWEEGVED